MEFCLAMGTACTSRGILECTIIGHVARSNKSVIGVTKFGVRAASQSPKGFGPKPVQKPRPAPKTQTSSPLVNSPKKISEKLADEYDKFGNEEPDDDTVPEVVTNRMLKRLVITVGIPMFIGLSFFPLFYYLKVVQKVDLPEWVPLITSSSLFGLAGLGISYGVLSTSWDPLREGSLLGWTEAKANWPVFMQTLGKKNEMR